MQGLHFFSAIVFFFPTFTSIKTSLEHYIHTMIIQAIRLINFIKNLYISYLYIPMYVVPIYTIYE